MTKPLLRHQQRQTITVKLPKRADILRRTKICGTAIRKKHASMLRFASADTVGVSRLVSVTEQEAVYEVWIRSAKAAE